MSSQSSTNRRIQTEEAQIGQRQLGGIMEGRMRRRAFVAGIGGFLAQPWAASAVSPVKRYRVGFLDAAPRERNVNFAAFQQVLLEHGYTEGQDLTFEYRSASGRNASFAELASELVSLQVDVIVTRGTPAALAARWRTLHSKWGPLAIFIGRFSGPLRAVVPLVAGIFAMPFSRFQIANFASAFAWVAMLLTLGDVVAKVLKLIWP